MYIVNNKLEKEKGNATIIFFDISIEKLNESIAEAYSIISDSSWIKRLDNEALKKSFEARLEYTIKKLESIFKENNSLSKSIGEYLISINSKTVLVKELNYSDIPLGEVIGKRSIGNGGFDYYSENSIENYIIFGEAKYINNKNAYNTALYQIIKFIQQKKDDADYADICSFVSEKAGKSLVDGKKGYSAGFSLCENSEKTIKKILSKPEFQKFLEYEELILIGVRI